MMFGTGPRVDIGVVIGVILEIRVLEKGPRHPRGSRDDRRYNNPAGVAQCRNAVQYVVKARVCHKVGVLKMGHVQHENNAVALGGRAVLHGAWQCVRFGCEILCGRAF